VPKTIDDLINAVNTSNKAIEDAINRLTAVNVFGTAATVAGPANAPGYVGGLGAVVGNLQSIHRTLQTTQKKIADKEEKSPFDLTADYINKASQGFQKALEGQRQSLLSTTAAGTAAGQFKGAADLAGLVPVFGKLAQSILNIAGTAAEWQDQTRKMRRELLDVNIQYGQESGPMQAVQERQKVRDLNLSLLRGDRLAESAELLAQANDLVERNRLIEETDALERKNRITAYNQMRKEYYKAHPDEYRKSLWTLELNELGDFPDKVKQWAADQAFNASEAYMNDLNEFVDNNWAKDYMLPTRWGVPDKIMKP